MSKKCYEIEKNVEKILRGGSSGFLPFSLCQEIQTRLKKGEYRIFCPYEEADKVILYGQTLPKVRLFQICCYEKEHLRHSSILGSLFGLHISLEMFGDIVSYQGNFYVYLLDEICDFVMINLTMVGRIPIKLKEVDVESLADYKRNYKRYELVVASLRIDAIIARLIGCNREKVQEKVKENRVVLNGEILKRASYVTQDGDVFSIRGCGKYRYRGIVGMTKKNHYVIAIDQYLS